MKKKPEKRVRRKHSDEFRRNAVSLVEDQEELDRLRKEIQRLRMECDILKKATATLRSTAKSGRSP